MNRLTVVCTHHSGCVVCGGDKRVRVDVADCGITGIYPCPACVEAQPLRDLLAPLSDYLVRPGGEPA